MAISKMEYWKVRKADCGKVNVIDKLWIASFQSYSIYVLLIEEMNDVMIHFYGGNMPFGILKQDELFFFEFFELENRNALRQRNINVKNFSFFPFWTTHS